MVPVIPRGEAIRRMKQFFSSEERIPKERFDKFLMESASVREELEDRFFELMKSSDLYVIDYIRELGTIDSELPGKNMEEFDKLLAYLWDKVWACVMTLEEAIETVCSAFPNYEMYVLKSAFSAYKESQILLDTNLPYLLERMADYDEIDGSKHFSSYVDINLPEEYYGPVINIPESIEDIFELMGISSPIYDIVWLLENRFGVDGCYLERKVYDRILEILSESSLDDMAFWNGAEEFFKISDGYKLFLELLPEIMLNGTSRDAVKVLSEEYGIDINFSAIQN